MSIKGSGGVIICGTDTNVGKTIITTGITLFLNKHGVSACPFKPYESGKDSDINFITSNLKKSGIVFNKKDESKFNLYHFKQALSPHLASKNEKIKISEKKILDNFKYLKKQFESIVVEPAGGLLVPINDKTLQIDLLKKFKLPVLLVARPSIGTINHTLLSIKALKDNNLKILGIIFCNGTDKDNRLAIEKFSKYKVIMSVPHFKTNKEMLSYFCSEGLCTNQN